MMRKLSVIIPALNEADDLPRLLSQLRAQQGIVLQIIVADGGSRDATVEIARDSGATAVITTRGRATQMNAGAAIADADWLLFLHADSELTSSSLLQDALAHLRAQSDRDHVAGHFPLRFQRHASGHDFFFRYLEGKTRLNRRHTIHGDQGLMIPRQFFRQLGGYDDRLPYLEDQRIAASIFEQGRWVVLPGHLLTSARRFEVDGHRNAYTLMALLMGLHAAELDAFFTGAPSAYRVMGEGDRLDLRPLLKGIRRTLRQQGARKTAGTLWRVGEYVRQNAWQLAYYRDLRCGDDAHLPRLRRFERHLEARLDNPCCRAMAALGVTAWFYGWLPLRHSSLFSSR